MLKKHFYVFEMQIFYFSLNKSLTQTVNKFSISYGTTDFRSVQKEPIGLELVQPTENQGDSDREEDSVHRMVAVHTHHGDRGKIYKGTRMYS